MGTADVTPISQAPGGGKADDVDRNDALRKAYSAATKALREKYRDEFTALYVAEAKQRGVDYQPPLTAEQKAEQEMARLLQEFPELRSKVAPASQPTQSAPAPTGV